MSIVDINIKIPKLMRKFMSQTHRIHMVLAATMQTQRAMIFDKQGAYHGRKKWDKLKFRKGQILSDTGTLRKSIGPSSPDGVTPGHADGTIVRYSGDVVTIGTNIKYAAVHNYGKEILPKYGTVLRFPNGKGGFIFAKRVTIPQRQFNDINERDTKELRITMRNMMAEIINGKN